MSEINLNALSRSLGVDKTYSTSNQKDVKRTRDDRDTVHLSRVPDFSALEAALEDEFAAIRSKFEGETNLEKYPPLETIDRLSRMFALNISSDNKQKDPLAE